MTTGNKNSITKSPNKEPSKSPNVDVSKSPNIDTTKSSNIDTSKNSNIDTSNIDIKSMNENKIKNLIQENNKLNNYVAEQEEALFNEIQKNAKLEKANNEMLEQINFYKMEVVDLNQKITYITNKINCDGIQKDLIYKQQAEIYSLKEELAMSKSTSTQLRSRLKSQVEELKFIKRQSLQITKDMAKEYDAQMNETQHQLREANKTIDNQKVIIEKAKEVKAKYQKAKSELEKVKSELEIVKSQYKKESEKSDKDEESLKLGVKALISIIEDLEKEKEESNVFFNEAGEEIVTLKEQLKIERKDNNVMANEMGQEIVNLNQQVVDYENKINKLNNEIATKTETVKSVMESYYKNIFKQINDTVDNIKSDLSNYDLDQNIDKCSVIERIGIKLNKFTDILNQHKERMDDGILSERNVEIIESAKREEESIPFKEKLTTLKNMYNDSVVTINEMGNELLKSKAQNESDSKNIEVLSEIIVKLLETVADLESDKASLQKNVDEYLTIINDCGEDIRKLHFNERDLITAISESGHEICVLKQKIEEMINYQEKYMSIDGENLMNKVASLTSRNQELEKELTLLRNFDINNSLKKSLEEGQLQSAWFEISKLRSHVEKLTQNSKQLEKDLKNARTEISSIIKTRDEAIISKDEADENFEALHHIYMQQMNLLGNEMYKLYSVRPSEAINRILNLINDMKRLPNFNNVKYENRVNKAKYESLERKLHEAEDIIDTLTRENFELEKKSNKLNKINEKLVAKIVVQYNDNQEGSSNLSQYSSMESIEQFVPKRSQVQRNPSISTNSLNGTPSSNRELISPIHDTSSQLPPRNTPPSSSTPTPTQSPTPTQTPQNNQVSSQTPTPSPTPTPASIKNQTSTEASTSSEKEDKTPSHLSKHPLIHSQSDATTPSTRKKISIVSNKADDFKINETKEEYNKLLNYFGSIPHNNRVLDIKNEYNEMKDYMSYEIQNQGQIMEVIKSGDILFYSSDQ